MDNDKIVDVINDLIEVSKDGQNGFRASAERATAPRLKEVFAARATECQTGVAELQTLVVRYGGKPDDSGSVGGALHRGWTKVLDTLTGDSDQPLLNEAERGEDHALAAYRKALKTDGLPADVIEVINRQMAGVQRNHDQIKMLRDTYKASH